MIVLGIRGGERLSEEQFLARLKAIYQIIRQSKTLEVALETVGEGAVRCFRRAPVYGLSVRRERQRASGDLSRRGHRIQFLE